MRNEQTSTEPPYALFLVIAAAIFLVVVALSSDSLPHPFSAYVLHIAYTVPEREQALRPMAILIDIDSGKVSTAALAQGVVMHDGDTCEVVVHREIVESAECKHE